VLNLGDAPYLDEIFAEESQNKQQAAHEWITGDDDPISLPAPDPAKNTCCGYQSLLHLYAIVPDRVTLPMPSVTENYSSHEFRLVAFVPSDPLEPPPRSSFRPH